MDHVSQSAVSVKALSLAPRTILMLAAWVEIIVGASFFLAFNTQSQFLFGATPDAIGVLFVRFSGIALVALGLACLPSNGTHRSAARALLIFNVAVTIFFAWAALTITFRGLMLWPVVILHAVIAIALALSSRHIDA